MNRKFGIVEEYNDVNDLKGLLNMKDFKERIIK